MNIVPKQNPMTDREELDLAVKMAGPGAEKQKVGETLNVVRAMANRQHAQNQAQQKAKSDSKQQPKRNLLKEEAQQQKEPLDKTREPIKAVNDNKQKQLDKSQASKDMPKAKAANDNKAPKPLKEGQSGVVNFNGRTFVHQSVLQKQSGPQKESSPQKTESKSQTPKRNLLAEQSDGAKKPSPEREKDKERERGRSR